MLLAAAPGAVANNGHRNLDSLDALRELLTERQIEVLRLLSQGKPDKSIARDLNISEGTVKIHLAAIFRALDVRNRVEAVVASRKLAELEGRDPGAGEKRGRKGGLADDFRRRCCSRSAAKPVSPFRHVKRRRGSPSRRRNEAEI